MKKAILIISFGTTNEAALKNCILPLEQDTAKAFPDWTVRRCFTSQVVLHRLAQRGIPAASLEQALQVLVLEHYRQVILFPTLLTDGGEYRKIRTLAAAYCSHFDTLSVAKPLLNNEADYHTVAAFIRKTYPVQEQEALLLMGHGSADSDNPSLLALSKALHTMDHRIFLAALLGEPGLARTLTQIRQLGYTKVLLIPLMLTAGEHALKHLAGPAPSSWQSQCRAAGLETACRLTGLGEYPQIRELYLRHLSASITNN